jgi:hypothetical protein
MDTLPQHLVRRLFGELRPASSPGKYLPPVDFCVMLEGPNAVDLARVTFHSFKETVSALDGVTFHLINKDLSERDFAVIAALVPGCRTYHLPPTAFPADFNLGDDTTARCEWMVEHCGNKQFVVLCHFDLFFIGDFLNLLRSLATDRTGMLGQHCPFMLLNRQAYAESVMKFHQFGPFFMVPHEQNPNQLYLYHHLDKRVRGSKLQVACDMGEQLELELRCRGWDCDPLREEHGKYFYHFSGGGRVTQGSECIDMARRARMFIEEYQIP